MIGMNLEDDVFSGGLEFVGVGVAGIIFGMVFNVVIEVVWMVVVSRLFHNVEIALDLAR